jgi:tetratricopeptide (TPR) repeat protein
MRIFLPLIVYCLLFSTSVFAQPSWTKKAAKSVFTLKTFDADGALLGSSCGFYVGANGEAVSCFSPFKGAVRAVVIDGSGKENAVTFMLGANETYDVARFMVDTSKPQPLTVAPGKASEYTSVWLLPWRETKNVPEGIIRKTETFNGEYGYYTVAVDMPEGTAGAPLLDDEGLVVGIMQQPYNADDSVYYAVSARFADSLRISGLSINDPVLRSTGIKKALPDDIAQAQLTLYVAGAQMDSLAYATLVDDFIAKFPKSQEGYVYRAQLAANGGHYNQADRDMEVALRLADNPDEVHYSLSQMIYQKALYHPQPPYEPWTLERALTEAEAANAANPQPTYRHQQAVVMFAQKRYDDAYAVYEELFASPMRSADLFYEASRCKAMAGDTTAQIALLDSCVAQFSRPYLKEAAPYLLVSAQARMNAGRNREAVGLLNDYEQLMAAQVNDQFYYLRFQAEIGGRLFQQALNDITKAINMAPQSDLYYAEKASLQVRVGQYDEAIETANECIKVAPDHSDGYLFLGLAQCLKGMKDEGVKNLRKAQELGDPQAEGLIEKYAQ